MISYIDSKKKNGTAVSFQKPIWRDDAGKILCPGKEKCQKCSEDCPVFLNTQGAELVTQNEYRKACELFKRATEIAPDFYDAHNNLGMCHGLLHDFDNAAKSYLLAHKADHTKPNPIYGLMLSTRDQGKQFECLQWCLEYCYFPKEQRKVNMFNFIDGISNDYFLRHSLTEVMIGRNYHHYKSGVYDKDEQRGYIPEGQVELSSLSGKIACEWESDWSDKTLESISHQNELKPYLKDDCWIKLLTSNHHHFIEYYILVVEVANDHKFKDFYAIRKVIGADCNEDRNDYRDVVQYELCEKMPPEVTSELTKLKCCRYIPKDYNPIGCQMPQNCRMFKKVDKRQYWFITSESAFYPDSFYFTCYVDENNAITKLEANMLNQAELGRFKRICRPFGVDYYNGELMDAVLALIDEYDPEEYLDNVKKIRKISIE